MGALDFWIGSWDASWEGGHGTNTVTLELGGHVVVPTFDAPWVRMAVIADPDGAQFTASQFVPPTS